MLVVVADPDVDRPDVHAVEKRRPQHRMIGELSLLVRGQLSGFLQNAIRDRDLAEIVQPSGELELLDVLVLQAEITPDGLDEKCDSLECAPVYSSLASTTRMRFSAARSRACLTTRRSSSSGLMVSATAGL